MFGVSATLVYLLVFQKSLDAPKYVNKTTNLLCESQLRHFVDFAIYSDQTCITLYCEVFSESVCKMYNISGDHFKKE